MGKSKKSRTAPPAVQQVMMPHFMPGMSPAMPSNWPGMSLAMPSILPGMGIGMGMGMAPGTVTALAMENRGESSSSESETFEHKRKQNAITLYQLPAKHLRQLVKALVPDLETLITEFDKETLTRILYSFSGLMPQTRCKSFEALEILIRH